MPSNKIFKTVVVSGIFSIPLIPLLVITELYFPFITSKAFAFRIITEIVFAAWLVLAFRDERYRPRFSWILGAFGIFVGWMALADIFGASPYNSFWSNFERMDGFVTLLHLFAYFIVLVSALKAEALWRRFFILSVSASILVAALAFREPFGEVARLQATFSNASYLAGYALFHVFLAFLLATKTKYLGAPWWFFVSAGALNAVVLFQTATRGALVGLAVGAIITTALLALFRREHKLVRRTAAAALVFFVFAASLFWAFRDSETLRSSHTLSRIASISLENPTVKSRLITWSVALKGFRERPLLGWGQENFDLVFNKHYDPRLFEQEAWFDRAHNAFLDWLVAGGAAGGLLYALLFITPLYYLWRVRDDDQFLLERALMTGLIAAYAANNFFVFDHITTYVFFMSLLGFVHVRFGGDGAVLWPQWPERFWLRAKISPAYGVGALVLTAFFAVYVLNSKPLFANMALKEAASAKAFAPFLAEGERTAMLGENLGFFLRAIAYDSFGTTEAREELVRFARRVAELPIEEALHERVFATAQSEIEKEVARFPRDARAHFFKGSLYGAYGYSAEARGAFEEALRLSPDKQYIIAQIGLMHIAEENYPEAIKLFRRVHELDPASRAGQKYLAGALIYAGKNEEAENALKDVYQGEVPYDPFLINAHAAAGNYEALVPLWEKGIRRDPADIQAYISLAVTHAKLGDHSEAVRTIKNAIAVDERFRARGEIIIRDIEEGVIR